MKTVNISFAITPNEEKQLRRLHREYEDTHTVSISVSEYIRRTLFPPVSNPIPLSAPTSERVSEPTNKYSFDKLS
jgi:hypothetical protein